MGEAYLLGLSKAVKDEAEFMPGARALPVTNTVPEPRGMSVNFVFCASASALEPPSASSVAPADKPLEGCEAGFNKDVALGTK